MIHLILDTNIWLYMANGFDSISEKINIGTKKHIELFEKIKKKTELGEYKVLVNEIILLEWYRNKPRASEHILELKKERSMNIQTVLDKNGGLFGETIKPELKRLHEHYKLLISINEQHINEVEDFLKSCPHYDISTSIKLEIAELAIKKEKAPFKTNKNNCADAAILFGAVDYLKQNLKLNYEKAIFVSANYKEYGQSKHSRLFHHDLTERIGDVSLEYHQHFFNLLEITEDIQFEIDAFHHFMQENFYFSCMTDICHPYRNDDNSNSFGYLENRVRIFKNNERVDPNQLYLFDINEIRNNEPQYTVLHGNCTTCETNHTECPNCNDLLVDLNGSEQYFCMDCGEGYEIGTSLKHNDRIIFPIEMEEFHL